MPRPQICIRWEPFEHRRTLNLFGPDDTLQLTPRSGRLGIETPMSDHGFKLSALVFAVEIVLFGTTPSSDALAGEPCNVDDDCNDGNPCTNDVCGIGYCEYHFNNALCDDGCACTKDDVCNGGECSGTLDPSCDKCFSDSDCEDGDPCTNNTCRFGTCSLGGVCVVSPKCVGNNPCTIDQCNNGVCEYDHNDGVACDDGDLCTRHDTCAGGVCAGTPIDCPGLGDACHVAICHSLTGTCEALPVNEGEPCDDGLSCTVNDTCASGTCVGTPTPACCKAGSGFACDGDVDLDDYVVLSMCFTGPAGSALPPECEPADLDDDRDVDLFDGAAFQRAFTGP